MPEFTITEDIQAPAGQVWPVLADFGGIDRFMPGVENVSVTGDGIGALRVVEMAGGMKVTERLESFDPDGRSLSYSVTEGPMPVENYLATIQLTDVGADRSRITWSASFESPGMSDEQTGPLTEGMKGAYTAAIGGLKELVEK